MMKPRLRIAFFHSGKAFLPGIKAYTEYFSRKGIDCISVNKNSDTVDAKVHWHFMGSHFRKKTPGTFLIHEYASASVPPFNGLKDLIKNTFNTKPDLRVFLNKAVEQKLNFKDNVPAYYRDVGIYKIEKKYNPETNKAYDFIFTGAVTKDMKFEKFLQLFVNGPFRDKNIFILGRTEAGLHKKFSQEKNIIIHPPVPANEVYDYLAKARFAVNYKPDIEPYNFQTSTKLLEYINYKIPVISTRNKWVEDFIEKSGAKIYLLNNDLSDIDFTAIENYKYNFPDMDNYNWDLQIEKSGLPEIIKQIAG